MTRQTDRDMERAKELYKKLTGMDYWYLNDFNSKKQLNDIIEFAQAVRKEERENREIIRKNALDHYKRLFRSLMGDDVADEFSEKLAKGWANLMRVLDEVDDEDLGERDSHE